MLLLNFQWTKQKNGQDWYNRYCGMENFNYIRYEFMAQQLVIWKATIIIWRGYDWYIHIYSKNHYYYFDKNRNNNKNIIYHKWFPQHDATIFRIGKFDKKLFIFVYKFAFVHFCAWEMFNIINARRASFLFSFWFWVLHIN